MNAVTPLYIAGMLKVPAILFLFLFCSTELFSQRLIKGRVVDAASGQPVAGSSVFISNTSKGTVSGRDGSFELSDIPVGKYDLIISSVGYQTNVFNFSTDELPLNLRIEMEIKVRELDNVTVEPSVEEGWDKWGKSFTDNFLGMTPNASSCRIKNFKSIKFRFYRKSNRLIAYSDEPLVMENKALGYKITYQLEDFEINFKEHTSLFSGYPLFEDLNKKTREKVVKKRDEAFYGSMMEFMRCIYNNNLAANGYEVRRMIRTPNHEKERIKQFYRPTRVSISTGGISTNSSGNTNTTSDSSAYYDRIMRQKDYIDTYSRDLLTADSITVGTEGKLKLIYFTDYLYITYKKEFEDKMYLNVMGESRRPTFQQSHVWLIKPIVIAIDANGSYFPPQNIFTMSYWGWNEKMSNVLPLDYVPEEKN